MRDRAVEQVNDPSEWDFDLLIAATTPGLPGVVQAYLNTTDVVVAINHDQMVACTTGEEGLADLVEEMLRALRPELTDALRSLSRELLDAHSRCALVRMAVSTSAQSRWNAKRQKLAGLPSQTRCDS